jgi:hypothetical protein
MPTLPTVLWCAAGSPIIQGFLTGLALVTVGLAFFPFTFVLSRPAAGSVAKYARSVNAIRWARIVGPCLFCCAVATIGGYLVIFVNARGRFCDARLTPSVQVLTCCWSVAAIVTFVLIALAVALRYRARRAAESRG